MNSALSLPTFGVAPPVYELPAATILGPVSLQVASLDRSIAYYSDVIGLRALKRSASSVLLAAHDHDDPLIALHERSGIKPMPPQQRYGLFHVAIRLPDRPSLGRFLMHVMMREEPVGMSDHLVSEALYLTDPDGLGLEVYTDRPSHTWTVRQQQLAMSSDPLQVDDVVAAGAGVPWTGAPNGTRIGHVHLHVGDLIEAAQFYHTILGFRQTVWSYPGALFLAAGEYHHHLGTNTWARQAEPARDDEARLLEWSVVLPSVADIGALTRSCERHGIAVSSTSRAEIVVHDPWGTAVRVFSNSLV